MPTNSDNTRGRWMAKAVQSRNDAAATPNPTLATLLIEIADTYEHLAKLPASNLEAMIEREFRLERTVSPSPSMAG